MERTPIKVPGKNNRDGRKPAVSTRKALNRPRGRPLKVVSAKPAQDDAISTPVVPDAKKARSLKHLKSRRKMSLLEKLPTELLETIYLYCLNLALPNSSPIIGAKLSSDAIYTKTILAAFDATWEKFLGKVIKLGERRIFAPPGDAALQSAILRLRWARLPVVLRSKDIWRKMYAPDRELDSVLSMNIRWRSQLHTETFEEPYWPHVLDSAALTFENNYAEFLDFMKRAKEESSLRNLEAVKEEPSMFLLEENLNQHTNMCIFLNVAEGTQIPTSLLMGPWSEEALEYLFWFVNAGARIDWVSSTSGEAALLGYKDAVVEGKIEVIELLLLAGVEKKLDADLIMFTLKYTPASCGFVVVVLLLDLLGPTEPSTHEIVETFRNDPDHEHEIEKLCMLDHYLGDMSIA